MELWIEANARFQKTMENGKIKKVTEQYLVSALSMSEAEARVTEELKPFISGDFTVSATKESNISEIFYDDRGDRWYRVKAAFITLDEKSGMEKKTMFHYMVQAPDFQNALENFLDGMKGTVSDFEIVSIAETKIMDVFETKLDS